MKPDGKALAALASDFAPMSPGDLSGYMPETGARDDIGPLPRFAALYLLSMDPRAKANVVANGSAGGSFQIHYRDKAKDLPVSLDDYPYMTILGNPGDTHNPAYRQEAKGLLDWAQVRAQAWSMLTLGGAAYIIPDADPLKPGLLEKLRNNLARCNRHTSNDSAVDKLGWLDVGPARVYDPNAIAPWQDDFFTYGIGHLADLGFTEARNLPRVRLRWLPASERLAIQKGDGEEVRLFDLQGRRLDADPAIVRTARKGGRHENFASSAFHPFLRAGSFDRAGTRPGGAQGRGMVRSARLPSRIGEARSSAQRLPLRGDGRLERGSL